MVPLTVNGKVSGSAKIAPGKTFKVVGVDGSDVLVAMAGSMVRIPKENSNFDEALDAAIALAEEKSNVGGHLKCTTRGHFKMHHFSTV
jgi:hypothetical protein